MKKALLVLTAIVVSSVLFTSCFRAKSCECKDYDENGKVISEYSEPIIKGVGLKCKDMNYKDEYGKTECK